MTQEEFFDRLKSVPMKAEELDALCEIVASGSIEVLDPDRISAELRNRLFDVKTGPDAQAFIELALLLGACIGVLALDDACEF